MSKQQSIADARSNLPTLVRAAEAGRVIELTRRGQPVAVLLGQRQYERLLSEGSGFSDAYDRFREEVDLNQLEIDPDEVLAGVRDAANGRSGRPVSLKFLLDTNVVSEPLRKEPNAKIMRQLRRHEGEAAIASTVWHELRFGWARLPESRRKQVLDRYLGEVVLANFPILDYDEAAAEWHANERSRLEAAGRSAPFVDGQIAAVAHVNDLVLVTCNKSHFGSFRELRVRDWLR